VGETTQPRPDLQPDLTQSLGAGFVNHSVTARPPGAYRDSAGPVTPLPSGTKRRIIEPQLAVKQSRHEAVPANHGALDRAIIPTSQRPRNLGINQAGWVNASKHPHGDSNPGPFAENQVNRRRKSYLVRICGVSFAQ
jgi:hypothetical protein